MFGQPTRPYLSVSSQNKGSHFTCRTFLSKFVLFYSCEGLVSQLDHTCLCLPNARGHTSCVPLFLSKITPNTAVKVWSVNWTIPDCLPHKRGHILHAALF